MKVRVILFLFLNIISAQLLFGQENDEVKNIYKTLANNIDFLINSRQTDSLYNLANDQLRSQVSKAQFTSAMEQIYTLGRIHNLSFDKISDDHADFIAEFADHTLLLSLGFDKDYKLNVFKFSPYQNGKTTDIQEEPESTKDIEEPMQKNSLAIIADKYGKAFSTKKDSSILSIGILHNNKIQRHVFSKSSIDTSSVELSDHLYSLGDVSQIFTATLLGVLHDRGTIDPESSIYGLLPDSIKLNSSLENITFRSLADHTSGLPSGLTNDSVSAEFSSDQNQSTLTIHALYSFLRGYKLDDNHMSDYRYSPLGYILLSDLLGKVHGDSYQKALQNEILDPLELKHTKYLQNSNTILQSSLEDMIAFARQQLLLPETQVQKAMATTREFSGFDDNDQILGLGWHTKMIEGTLCYYIESKNIDHPAYLAVVPDAKSAVVILSDTEYDLKDIVKSLLQEICKSS